MQQEKEFVVVKDGQRVTGLLTKEDADRKADQERKKLNEQDGQKTEASTVSVKRNLLG